MIWYRETSYAQQYRFFAPVNPQGRAVHTAFNNRFAAALRDGTPISTRDRAAAGVRLGAPNRDRSAAPISWHKSESRRTPILTAQIRAQPALGLGPDRRPAARLFDTGLPRNGFVLQR